MRAWTSLKDVLKVRKFFVTFFWHILYLILSISYQLPARFWRSVFLLIYHHQSLANEYSLCILQETCLVSESNIGFPIEIHFPAEMSLQLKGLVLKSVTWASYGWKGGDSAGVQWFSSKIRPCGSDIKTQDFMVTFFTEITLNSSNYFVQMRWRVKLFILHHKYSTSWMNQLNNEFIKSHYSFLRYFPALLTEHTKHTTHSYPSYI